MKIEVQEGSALRTIYVDDSAVITLADDTQIWPARSETPAETWRPIAEGLPTESGELLVTLTGGAIRNALWADGDWSDPDFGASYEIDSEADVLAWMPLPKPYAPSTDGKED